MKKRYLACFCTILVMFLCACAGHGDIADDMPAADNSGAAKFEDPAAEDSGEATAGEHPATDRSRFYGWWEVATGGAAGNVYDFDTPMKLGFYEDGTMIYEGIYNTFYGDWYIYAEEPTLECRLFRSYQEFLDESGAIETPVYSVSFLDDDTMELYNTFYDYSNTYVRIPDYDRPFGEDVSQEVPNVGESDVPSDDPSGQMPSAAADYTPGNENTISTPRFMRKTDYSAIAVQDQKIYYVGSDHRTLYKLSLGAPASEAEPIWFDTDGAYLNYDDIQVLGNWVYIQDETNLYRVMTTPGGFEMLIDGIDATKGYLYQSIVRGNQIYYTAAHSEQISAQSFDDYADIVCYNIESGESCVLASVLSRPLRIECYTNDVALLVSSGYSGGEYLCYFDDNVMTEAPEIFEDYDSIISDGTSFYMAVYDDGTPPYRSSSTSIYRLSPENGYTPELMTSVDGLFHLRTCGDGMYFGESNSGLSYIQDGTLHEVNTDSNLWAMCYPGDGYIYYRSFNNLVCRVQLDGTGWEQL